MDKYFPAGLIHRTGNPIRTEIARPSATKKEAVEFFGLNPSLPVVFVTGGSQGAFAINQAIEEVFGLLEEQKIQLIWQTGPQYSAADTQSKLIRRFEFLDRMDLAYLASNIVVSRAGALSISELATCGKTAILVPFPWATANHQAINADRLVQASAASCIPAGDLKGRLGDEIMRLVQNPVVAQQMASNIKQFGSDGSARRIVEWVAAFIEERRRK